MSESYEFVIDWMGAPYTANQVHRWHWAKTGRARAAWSDAAIQACRLAKIPTLDRVRITMHGEYPNRRHLPDPEGIAPCGKAVIDGIVLAGVLADDNGKHVARVEYAAPQVTSVPKPCLVVTLTPLETTQGPSS